jgi:hypothetical protein
LLRYLQIKIGKHDFNLDFPQIEAVPMNCFAHCSSRKIDRKEEERITSKAKIR